MFEHRCVLSRLWNIHLPLILRQFETHSVSLLLKVAPICCSYSVTCVQQYATPTFHFAAHSVRFPLLLRGERVRQSMCGCQITILLPAILRMLLKSLAIWFFTEWGSNLCRSARTLQMMLQQKAAISLMWVKLKCSSPVLNPGCSQTAGSDPCLTLTSVLPM